MSRIKKRCLFSGRTILKFIVIIKHCHFKSQVISGRELKDSQPSHPSPTLVTQPLSYPLTRTRYQVSSPPKPPPRFNSKSALAWSAFAPAKLHLYCRMLRIPLPGISPFPIKFLPPLLPGFRLCSRPPVLLQQSREKAPTEHWCGRSGYNYTLKSRVETWRLKRGTVHRLFWNNLPPSDGDAKSRKRQADCWLAGWLVWLHCC